MPATVVGTEEEIGRLLAEGNKPAELIQRGFKRGTVYKVNRRLQTGGTPSESGDKGLDPSIESDPEVMDLRKALRKAELERQLEEFKGPSSTESRLLALEEQWEEMEATLDETMAAYRHVVVRVDGSPLNGLRQNFECSCGAKGHVSARIVCTSCGRETSQGWWPDSNQR